MSSTLRYLALLALATIAAACASEANSKICPVTGIVCPEDTICAAAQPVCLVSSCGNGITDAGEQCDDGNIIDGDRCSSLCRIETCGNGIMDVGEECDPPPGNTEDGDGCSSMCTIEICGNGRTDFGEACDDGNFKNGDECSGNSVELPDGQGGTVSSPGPCMSNEKCGNGIVDYQVGEVCDDGNVISEDGCNSDCKSGTGCGNGIRELDEECDDGNDVDTDRCLNDCTLSMCGDGVIETGREQCDAGNRDMRGAVETAECNIDCTISTCGDRRVNTTDGEECDAGVFGNGNTKNCTLACKFNFCGDGNVDGEAPNIEACDDGNQNNSDGCNNACQLATCGNSVIDAGEECDDGDNPASPNNNDGCVFCKLATCGDGWVRAGVEECDGDGNGTGDTVPGDGCSPGCTIERCGNSIIDFGEQCDDGQAPVVDPPSTTASPNSTLPENTDACVNAATFAECRNARCGDGYLRDTEACDDGNNVDGDGCSANCLNEGCGNGILETVRGEQCDDGGTVGGDGCSATCQLEDCGDGFMDVGEECDGNNMGMGGETPNCNADCTLRTCGDGKINNAAGEQCDDGTIGGVNQNQNNRDCRADCRLNFCTDGFQNTAGSIAKREACDDGNMNNNDGCSNACQLASCGNGLLDPGEECDLGTDDPMTPTVTGNNNNGACTLGCKIAKCGDAFVWAGVEECDGASLDNNGPCLAGVGPNHIGGCRFARCGDGSIQASSRNAADAPITETCDNGAANFVGTPPDCAYGLVSCSFCSAATCDPVVVSEAAKTRYCGDGTRDMADGEACDLAALNGKTICPWGQNATTACNTCSADCKTASTGTPHYCGDGVVDNSAQPWGGNEQCDLGAANGTMPACPYGETCLRCSATCTNPQTIVGPHCGDGIRNGTEQCDDGDNDNGDGCSSVCSLETGFTCTMATPNVCSSTCGDGVKAANEVCDDGNTMNGDGCASNCAATEANWTCMQVGTLTRCTKNQTCGDGIVSGTEMCDNMGHNNGVDCLSNDMPPAYGSSNACVACDSNCMMVVSSDYCGDGSINGTEQCEAGNINGATCTSIGMGFDAGSLSCNAATCTYNTSMCTDCGNNIREMGEACDNGGGNGDGCSTTCTVETGFACVGNVGQSSTCSSTCGDGVKASNEACDDAAPAEDGDGCSATCTVEANWQCSGSMPSVCTCENDNACPSNQFCNGVGACVNDFAVGATCARDAQCEFDCDGAPMTCQAMP